MKCVRPGRIDGIVKAPPSKSVFQRAVAMASLAAGKTRISSGELCDDARASIRAARAVGAIVEERDECVEIVGGGTPKGVDVDCGESGLSLRMFTALSALFDAETTITARGTLARRPVGMIEKPLEDLGCSCRTGGGYPPIRVRGPIRGGSVEVDGSTSSQFLSGLLIALSQCENDSRVVGIGLASKPYVAMTIEMLDRFGVRVQTGEKPGIFFVPGRQKMKSIEVDVEGDWSAAAFLLVAGAVSGSVEVTGIDLESAQGDRAVLSALDAAGANCLAARSSVRAEQSALKAFRFDATQCPDLIPPLAVLAASCEGLSRISGASRLTVKESDRRAALVEELGKLGLGIRADGDVLLVRGGRLRGGRINPRGDHRIAMAAAVAALAAQEPVEIAEEHCVSKSYPKFFEDFQRLGAKIS